MNKICKQCPLLNCDISHVLCEQTPEFKRQKFKEAIRLPMYYGSGRWDRQARKQARADARNARLTKKENNESILHI